MTISDRLDEIEARANAATDGPWAARHRAGLDWLSQSPHVDNDGHEPGSSVGLADAVDPLWGSLWPSRNATADAEFIAHSRTDVPALVAALRAVLDLHRPLRLYEHEDVCGRTDEEHCDERHVEFEEGCEYYCLDHPTDYVMCAECRDVNGDSVDYPCPTVKAVTAALNDN